MPVSELRPGLFRIDLGRYQCHLWRDADGLLLVDSGEAATAEQLVAELAGMGIAPADLDVVVLTHFHDDHAGGAAHLSELGAGTVAAGAPDSPFVTGERPGPEPEFTPAERTMHDRVAAGLLPAPPVPVTRRLLDGDDLGLGATVVAVPGHTDGSVAVNLAAARVVLTGDTAAHFGGSVIPGVFNLDRARLATSLARLAELEVDAACFGHGDPLLDGAAAALAGAARAAAAQAAAAQAGNA